MNSPSYPASEPSRQATAQFTNFAADYSPILASNDQPTFAALKTTKVALPECAQNKPERPRRDHLGTPVPLLPVVRFVSDRTELLLIHSLSTR